MVELLVIVLILGIVAAVVIPNVGSFIGQGRDDAYASELQNMQTAVTAMLVDSTASELDSAQSDISDMNLVTSDNGTKVLSSYLFGLNSDGTVSTNCTYSFTIDGAVSQTTP